MSDRTPTRADYVKAARELGVELEPETPQKHGHVIGLNLSRKNQDGPPLTVDGVPFTDVSDITVDAAPGKGIRVTVTFNASHLGGIEPKAVSYFPDALKKHFEETP